MTRLHISYRALAIAGALVVSGTGYGLVQALQDPIPATHSPSQPVYGVSGGMVPAAPIINPDGSEVQCHGHPAYGTSGVMCDPDQDFSWSTVPEPLPPLRLCEEAVHNGVTITKCLPNPAHPYYADADGNGIFDVYE